MLTNRAVMSNGDMATNGLLALGANVVGLEGTSGSASMSGGHIHLPCVQIEHTQAQSWNPTATGSATGAVQVEANLTAAGKRVGGVAPTSALPRTRENLKADLQWRLGQTSASDAVLEYARTVLAGNPASDGDGDGDGDEGEQSVASSGEEEQAGGGCDGGCIGGIVGGCFVPVLMLILWMSGAFAPRCNSPFVKEAGADPTNAGVEVQVNRS